MGEANASPKPVPTPENRRTRGVSKNSVEAQRKLIDSAILVFGRVGFANAKTDEIAELAGYGQATVFFHFKTKAGLLEACLEHVLSVAKEGLVSADSSGTVELVKRLDRAYQSQPLGDFFARMLSEFQQNPAVQPAYAALHTHVRELIADALARETGAGAATAYRSAASILAMMVGVHAEQRLDTQQFSHADYREMLISGTRMVVKNLQERGGEGPT